MTFVSTQPDMLSAATGQLHGIDSELSAHNAPAAMPTMAVVPAAAGDASLLTAAQFAFHAVVYRAIGSQTAAVHYLFVGILDASAGSYTTTEAVNAISAT